MAGVSAGYTSATRAAYRLDLSRTDQTFRNDIAPRPRVHWIGTYGCRARDAYYSKTQPASDTGEALGSGDRPRWSGLRRQDDLHQIAQGELTTTALWAEMSQNGLGNGCSKAELRLHNWLVVQWN